MTLLLSPIWISLFLALGQPAPDVGGAGDPLAEGKRLLEDVRDGVFSFDDPAFYWFCRFAHSHQPPVESVDRAPDEPLNWKVLLERPSDYRGQLITIEGVVLSCQAHEVTNRPDLPRLYQMELSQIAGPLLCSLVLTENPGDVPLRSVVKAHGYFIKVRGYRSRDGAEGSSALVVANRLAELRTPAARVANPLEDRPTSWLVVAVAAMAIIWFVMRRRLRSVEPHADGPGARARAAKPSDRDFDWLVRTGQPRDSDRDE